METEFTGYPLQAVNIDEPGEKNNENIASKSVMFDASAVSILHSVFRGFPELIIPDTADGEGFSKTASVKFMITLQDEKDLRNLGYSQEQIDRVTPQEVADILTSGTKAVPAWQDQ